MFYEHILLQVHFQAMQAFVVVYQGCTCYRIIFKQWLFSSGEYIRCCLPMMNVHSVGLHNYFRAMKVIY